jgi:hypothetical protein
MSKAIQERTAAAPPGGVAPDVGTAVAALERKRNRRAWSPNASGEFYLVGAARLRLGLETVANERLSRRILLDFGWTEDGRIVACLRLDNESACSPFDRREWGRYLRVSGRWAELKQYKGATPRWVPAQRADLGRIRRVASKVSQWPWRPSDEDVRKAAEFVKKNGGVVRARPAPVHDKVAPKVRKERVVMKGKISGLTIGDAWAALFSDNERRAKKLTDAQLIEKMEEDFPSCKGKSTVSRPRMYRSCYNDGTYMYKVHGAAGRGGRPVSHEYDAKGNQVAKGTRTGKGGERAARPVERKGGGSRRAPGRAKGKVAKGRKAARRKAS